MISIARKFLTNEYSDEAFAIICYLRTCVTNVRSFSYISKDEAELVLYGDKVRTSDHRKITAAVLGELTNKQIIEKHDKFDIYVVRNKVFDSENKYILINQEVLAEFQALKLRNKWGIFHLYCMYVGSFSNKCNFEAGFMPLIYFANKLSVDLRTIIRYTKVLEDLKLIYIDRATFNAEENSRQTNTYGLYENKEKVRKWSGLHINDQDESSVSNWKRSVRMRYNYFANNPHEYNNWGELYEDVKKYNAMQNGGKMLDTSMFEDLT